MVTAWLVKIVGRSNSSSPGNRRRRSVPVDPDVRPSHWAAATAPAIDTAMIAFGAHPRTRAGLRPSTALASFMRDVSGKRQPASRARRHERPGPDGPVAAVATAPDWS
jgi:hypothetical protein